MPFLASILTNVIVFVPLIFLGGGQGGLRFMRDFGITFCVVCIASFVVAITVVPLLSGKLIHNLQPNKERNFPGVKKFFTMLVSHALRFRLITMLIVAGMMWAVFLLYGMIDKEPGGWQADRRLNINVDISHNYSMDEASRIMTDVEAELLKRKSELEISSVGVELNMGRLNRGQLDIYFTDAKKGGRNTVELEEAVRELLPVKPGFIFRVSRGHGEGGGGDIEVALIGERMDLLEGYAKKVEALMKSLPGVRDIDLSTEEGEKEVRVVVNRQRSATSGISASQVAYTVNSQLTSRPNSRFKSPEREIDIMLGLKDEDRLSLQGLETMEMYAPGGQRTALDNIATIETGRAPREIEKENRLYQVEVSMETGGGGIFMLSQDIAQRMSQIKMAPGYSWQLGHNYRNMIEEEDQSRFAIIFALVLIYIVLAALFESFIYPFAILLSVPFAIFGVALIFVATNTNLGTMAYIGVIIVCGLVVNNGILLVDCINLLRSRGLPRRQAITEAVQKRLRPILMTASTTVLSLVPMTAPLIAPSIFGPSEGRSAYWGPVGLAILGGMTTSTFLTLIITPTIYSLLDDLASGTKTLCARVFKRRQLE